MLKAKLLEEFPDEMRHLHRKAADWYAANDAPAEAVYHLLGSEDWEEAAELIESIAFIELEKSGEGPRLLRWLQKLPEPILNQHKTLLILYLRLVMLSLPPPEAAAVLTHAEVKVSSMLLSEMGGDVQELLPKIHQIHHLWLTNERSNLEKDTDDEHEPVYQMIDEIFQSHRDFQQDLIRASTRAKAVYETALARGHLFIILIAGGTCANLAFSQGQFRRSENIAHQVSQQAISLGGKFPEAASIALTALSNVYYERNQLTQAHQLLLRAIEINPIPANLNEPVKLAILHAKIQSAKGDNEAAFATIQTIRELHNQRTSSVWIDQDFAAYQAMFLLRQGDLSAAERQLRELGKEENHGFSMLVRAAILMVQNRNTAAEEILLNLINENPLGFYWMPILRARVMLSLALFDQNKINQARQVMAEAARHAAPEFFVQPFLVSGLKIVSLLSLVLHTENLDAGTRSFIKGTLTTLGYPDGMTKIIPQAESADLEIAASITPREQHILRLLSANLSNREIAEQCSISSSTVKTHLENIYRKLGVNSRTQAVSQARILNLV